MTQQNKSNIIWLIINAPLILILEKSDNMVYGYARVSTKRQIIDRQTERIKIEYPESIIFSETFTGTTDNRPQWQKLLKKVKSGDKIIFDSVSRMSRDAKEGIETYLNLYNMGIDLVFLNEPYINTTIYRKTVTRTIELTGNKIADIYIDATNKVLKILAEQQIEQAFIQAEKEVKDLKDRTKRGMAINGAGEKISKARTGRKFETPKNKVIKKAILKYCKEFGGILKDKEVLAILNGDKEKTEGKCSKPTFYKYKKELLEKNEFN